MYTSLNEGELYSVYLSGPMAGYDNHNFPEFERAAKLIRDKGFTVYSPHENVPVDSGGYRDYLPADVIGVCSSRAVALLKGWSKSKGCAVEIATARAIGMPLLDAYTLQPLDPASEALEIVYNGRQAVYSHPADDFKRTAALLTALFEETVKKRLEIGNPLFVAVDIPAIQRMVKESRLQATPGHADSLTDLVGYTLTQAMVYERERNV